MTRLQEEIIGLFKLVIIGATAYLIATVVMSGVVLAVKADRTIQAKGVTIVLPDGSSTADSGPYDGHDSDKDPL